MKNELVDTEKAVEVLKTQMGVMTSYFKSLNLAGMWKGVFAGNATVMGAVNGSVEGWVEEAVVDGMVDGVGP